MIWPLLLVFKFDEKGLEILSLDILFFYLCRLRQIIRIVWNTPFTEREGYHNILVVGSWLISVYAYGISKLTLQLRQFLIAYSKYVSFVLAKETGNLYFVMSYSNVIRTRKAVCRNVTTGLLVQDVGRMEEFWSKCKWKPINKRAMLKIDRYQWKSCV